MLNMTIEEFKKQLDELIETRQVLLEKQKMISCKTVNNDILVHDENMMVRFAEKENLAVTAEKSGSKFKNCQYSYSVKYRGVELCCYSSKEGYESFKKAGLLS